MRSSGTFIRISGPIPELKQISIDQWFGKKWILGRNRAKGDIGKQVCLFQIYWWSEGSHNPKKSLQLLSSIKLGNIFPALKLTQNWYVNLNISLS